MGRRSRSRSRSGGGRSKRLLVVGLLLVVVASTVTPTASFTVGSVDRSSTVDIVKDGDGIMTLDIADNLTAGTTQRLVNTTNHVGRDVNVTVTLQNDTWGTLHADGEDGDSVTYQLNQTELEQVDVTLNCEPTTDDAITFRIQADDPGFEADLNRSVDVNQTDCIEHHVVWTTDSGSELRSRSESGTVYEYNETASVIGKHSADLDGDGTAETPYVHGSTNKLRLIDTNNETSGVLTDDVRDTPTRLWTGSWNGSGTAVFYANKTDKDIYYVKHGQSPVHVASVKSKGVVGAGDIDGDGADELVYIGDSSEILYLEQDGTSHATGVASGSNNGIGMGEPADFNDDGTDRVPYIDGSNNVKLVDASGNTKTIVSGGAAKTFVAPYNWDTSDSQPEITFVDSTTFEIEYVKEIPASALDPGALEVKGTGYYADTDAGVA